MKTVAIAAVLLGLTTSCITMHVDNTALPFVNDPPLIGTWTSVDYLPEPALFVPGQTHNKPDIYVGELTFLEGGRTTTTNLTWTKGAVLDKGAQVADAYEFREVSGTTYLVLQWKTLDYSSFGMKPRYVVLKKK